MRSYLYRTMCSGAVNRTCLSLGEYYKVGCMNTDKLCPDCKKVKSTTDFPKNKNTPDGRATYCKVCHNSRSRASRDKAGGSRYYHLKDRYGMTREDFDNLIDAQGGLCAICVENKAGYVDHDHETGRVRGLLCAACNGGLGFFKDRSALLRSAAEYLEGCE